MPSVNPDPWWWLSGALMGLYVLGVFAAALFALVVGAAVVFDYLTNPPDWWKRWRGK